MELAALRAENLTKRYGRVVALDSLDLRVDPGEVFGFLGPNGAGKSTTIRLLLGLARPTAGRATVFGVDAADVEAAHRLLAYVPADVALWPRMTGAEILDLLGTVGAGQDPVYRAELVDRFELDPSRVAGTYSTGNRQKVALIAAFATRAPVLILDEPATGLDPLLENQFRQVVLDARNDGRTVFLSSHQLADVEVVCDRIGMLRGGRLADVTTVAELRKRHRTRITVTYAEHPPDLAWVAGCDDVEETGPSTLTFTVTGPPGPMLRELASTDIVAISVREPTLEEIFLDLYTGAER
jgi:ABC-2 type transport system ATP-binding protein